MSTRAGRSTRRSCTTSSSPTPGPGEGRDGAASPPSHPPSYLFAETRERSVVGGPIMRRGKKRRFWFHRKCTKFMYAIAGNKGPPSDVAIGTKTQVFCDRSPPPHLPTVWVPLRGGGGLRPAPSLEWPSLTVQWLPGKALERAHGPGPGHHPRVPIAPFARWVVIRRRTPRGKGTSLK